MTTSDRLNQKGGRLLGLAVLSSQLVNVVVFNGSPDETLSGRAYRQGVLGDAVFWGSAARWFNRVFFWQGDHCYTSHKADIVAAKYILSLYEGTK